jgi:hypothetical protein
MMGTLLLGWSVDDDGNDCTRPRTTRDQRMMIPTTQTMMITDNALAIARDGAGLPFAVLFYSIHLAIHGSHIEYTR